MPVYQYLCYPSEFELIKFIEVIFIHLLKILWSKC